MLSQHMWTDVFNNKFTYLFHVFYYVCICMCVRECGVRLGNVLLTVRKLGLNRRSWVLQQDKDPKHTGRAVLNWPAMSPDLNLTGVSWHAPFGTGIYQTFKRKYQLTSARSLWTTTRNAWRLSSPPKDTQLNSKEGCLYCCPCHIFCFLFETTTSKTAFVKLLWTCN